MNVMNTEKNSIENLTNLNNQAVEFSAVKLPNIEEKQEILNKVLDFAIQQEKSKNLLINLWEQKDLDLFEKSIFDINNQSLSYLLDFATDQINLKISRAFERDKNAQVFMPEVFKARKTLEDLNLKLDRAKVSAAITNNSLIAHNETRPWHARFSTKWGEQNAILRNQVDIKTSELEKSIKQIETLEFELNQLHKQAGLGNDDYLTKDQLVKIKKQLKDNNIQSALLVSLKRYKQALKLENKIL